MRFKIAIFLFGLVFLVGYSEEISGHKVKILEQEISGKEMELEKMKVLYEELLEKQENMETPPKIGLVLSGGGAKGVAHVGVLKMLEEYNIHIDYITGTSFGSIVGALYAVGYTADEIEKIIFNIDWDSFKNDKQSRKHSSFKYKREKEKYILNLEIDENYNLKFPKGVLTGEAFYLELKTLFMRVEGVDDFDNLNIPFRAISTNINTGRRYVVGEGDLAKAVFMSMAIPTILDPVEHNGEYYVDGGLVENLPVREVIEMGADIVIAVDISADSNMIKGNSNLFEVLEKMTTYKSQIQFEKAKELADILIVPDVKGHAIADFTGLERLVKKGVDETKKHREELEKLSTNKHKNKQNLKVISDKGIKIKVNEVVLIGAESLTLTKVLGVSGRGVPGEYTVEELALWMDKLKAVDIINRFFYVIEDEKLIINVKENEGKHLRLGFNYSDDFGATLRIVTDMKNYGLLENESMIMAEISRYPKIEFENTINYRFKESQYLGIINLGLTTDPLFIYDKDDKISDYNNYKLYISGGLGTTLFNSYLLATKFSYIGVKNEYTGGSKDFISSSSWEYIKNRTLISTDTRDNTYFSNGGANNRIEFFSGGDIKGYGDVEFYGGLYDLHKYIPIKEKFNIELFISGGGMDGGNIPENEYFKIGGLRNNEETNQFSFYGMNAMRKHVDKFYMGGINLRYKLNGTMYINVKYNIVTYSNPEFSLTGEESSLGEDFKEGVGIGLGLDTLIGPLEFVASNDADSDGILFLLFLGYEF